MRLLMIILVGFSALWGGYWFVGSTATETGADALISALAEDGTEIRYSSLSTRGFPNRFDTTIEDVDILDIASGIGWQGAFFQVFALSYQPNHIIAVWPDSQRILLPGGAIDITSDDMRASLVLEANTTLALSRFRFETDQVALRFPGGLAAGFEHAFIATRQATGRPDAHDLSVAINAFELPETWRAVLDPEATLPPRITGFAIDAILSMTAPVGRPTSAGEFPQLVDISIRSAGITWGDLALSISGDLFAGPAGYARGELLVQAENWQQVFEVLSRAGLLDPIWQGALAALETDPERPGHIDVPLSFTDGAIYLGPFQIGQAPRLN